MNTDDKVLAAVGVAAIPAAGGIRCCGRSSLARLKQPRRSDSGLGVRPDRRFLPAHAYFRSRMPLSLVLSPTQKKTTNTISAANTRSARMLIAMPVRAAFRHRPQARL